MKTIILQHWSGEMNKLTTKSSENVQEYSKRIKADYQLLRGNVFQDGLSAPLQKMFMLDKTFDRYDYVLMLDADVFFSRNIKINVFTDANGIGCRTQCHIHHRAKLSHVGPEFGNTNVPYWGGSIWRLDRKIRQDLRKHLNGVDLSIYCNYAQYHEDEGLMHRLAICEGLKENRSMYMDKLWNVGNYFRNVRQAHSIHIRKKSNDNPKIIRTKLENYHDLVKKGII